MRRFMPPVHLLFLLLITQNALAAGPFDGLSCPAQTCHADGQCTQVTQCLYVDASAAHCQVDETLSCQDIQSQTHLNGAGMCASLGDGSKDTPFCAISSAAQHAQGGNLVLIAPGRYLVPGGTHGLHTFSATGDSDKPITFRNAAFDPNQPQRPDDEVVLTPYSRVSGWSELASGSDYLLCSHAGIAGDNTTFNGIATNLRATDNPRPFMRLFNESCGVATTAEAASRLSDLSWLPAERKNAQGHYVQVWPQGAYGGSSHCPTVRKNEGQIAVRVEKTPQLQSCSDLNLDVTGVGHTIHLRSSGDVCGDLEEMLSGTTSQHYRDAEADHIRFEGLTIEAGNYGLTIETDGISLRYSTVQGAYKDGIKAIGNEPWDYRQPNQCARTDTLMSGGGLSADVQDLVNFCEGNTSTLLSGEWLTPPSCEGTTLDVDTLDPHYFYWPELDEAAGREAMRMARDATIDGHCEGTDCVYQSRQHIQKYCREVAPQFERVGGELRAIPDNCTDFYYFNARNVVIEHNDIRFNGEEGIDITGGDGWRVAFNTLHDSVVTHGSAQMPSGILSKNVSHDNQIVSNLLYNIHHTVTGILALGGSPEKAAGARNLLVRDNILMSVSGQKLLHMPNCEHCVLAHNLIVDGIIGEVGSRSQGILHVGGHRKSCETSAGAPIDCGGEKRSASLSGAANSVVNNVVELVSWRDREAYRAVSFGGVQPDRQSAYQYNGNETLCVAGNHIRGGEGIVPVTSHVTDEEVDGLACALGAAQTQTEITFDHPRVRACVEQVGNGALSRGQLVDCLKGLVGSAQGDNLALTAPASFNDLTFQAADNVTVPLGVCASSGHACSNDAQCPGASCQIDTSDPARCVIGPHNVQNGAGSECDLTWTAPLTPLGNTDTAYPQFSWKAAQGDSEFRFLLYRFHPDGGENNAHWYELLANDIVPATQCDDNLTCFHRAPSLLTDGTYTWKVRRHSAFGWSSWSATQVFYVQDPERAGHTIDQPTPLLSPVMSGRVGNDPQLQWQHDPYADAYSILLYRYEGGYQLLVNLLLQADDIQCDFATHCNIQVSELLQRMGSAQASLQSGTYTWKTKKWTQGTASSWNTPTHVFYVD